MTGPILNNSNPSSSLLLPPYPLHKQPLQSEAVAPCPTPAAPATVRPAPGWWEALLWMLGFLAVYSIPGLVFAIAALLAGVSIEKLRDTLDDYAMPIGLAAQVLAVGMTVFALRVRVGRNWIGAIQIERPALVPCVLAVLCLPALMILSGGIQALVTELTGLHEPTEELINQSLPQWGLGLCLLVVAVGAAVNEELFCRGFLGRGLVGRHGVLVGVLLASAIFGAIHLNLPQGIGAFVFGCGVHLAYLATRSLWVPMLLHFLNNAVGVLALSAFPPDFDPAWWQLLLFIVPATAVAIPSSYALYRLRVGIQSTVPVGLTIQGVA
jgi:membrane protease YdiL (CAAX protease family)